MKIPEEGEIWGILGGTFDPVHYGHLNLASEIHKFKSLDGVLLVPSFLHALKEDSDITQFADRTEMLNIATAQYDIFSISTIEKDNNLSGYTLDTVQAFKQAYPHTTFKFIIGSDNITQIHLWYQPDKIFEETEIIAGTRPHFTGDEISDRYLKKIEYIQINEMDISSTKIRELLQKQDYRSLTKMIHPGVIEYIKERQLYV